MATAHTKDVVRFYLDHGLLVTKEAIEAGLDIDESLVTEVADANVIVLGKLEKDLLPSKKELDWAGFERSKVLAEKGKESKAHEEFLKIANTPRSDQINPPASQASVKVVFSYAGLPRKREVQDFIGYYNARYRQMEHLLKNRAELQSAISISRALGRREKEAVALIAIVAEKAETKNGNLMLTLQDPTGEVKAVISKSKPELFALAKDIMLDEVIGVVGTSANQVVFANNVLWPDVPVNRELKKAQEPGYALVLSDLHIGSRQFLEEKFQRFLSWINGASGNEQQRAIAANVKYIFIVGDLVDGVGIYPEQEKDLAITDVILQYSRCAALLSQIPERIPIILSAGNHDAVRLAEPQPTLPVDFAKPLYDMPNVMMVSNPAVVNIHSAEGFSGFDALIYHGYSIDYYVANCDTIRSQGGYDRPDILMKFLMTRRHLAPTHTSSLFLPDVMDHQVIDHIPDFFLTGHIHKSAALNYRGITMVCGSCWQSKTSFQEKVGHNPEPGRVPVINLQTREIKILRF
ncbi:MAG: DNA-directed DNA polymerase II small subunit [Nanoarchaeota archaeon]